MLPLAQSGCVHLLKLRLKRCLWVKRPSRQARRQVSERTGRSVHGLRGLLAPSQIVHQNLPAVCVHLLTPKKQKGITSNRLNHRNLCGMNDFAHLKSQARARVLTGRNPSLKLRNSEEFTVFSMIASAISAAPTPEQLVDVNTVEDNSDASRRSGCVGTKDRFRVSYIRLSSIFMLFGQQELQARTKQTLLSCKESATANKPACKP